MKYIDAEKLIAEIERRRLSNRYIDTEGYENELLEIITSLQQEQPSNLKEAAEHSEIISYPMPEDGDIEKIMEVQKARIFHEIGFKAGAEWMAGQGKSIVAKIGIATEEVCCTIPEEILDSFGVRIDDEIVIQVRKK